MTINPDIVGIDISKLHLDVSDPRRGHVEHFANSAAAAAELAARFAAAGQRVVFEATGAYDRQLCLALHAAGVTFFRVNPGQARDFARAAGYLAKTDAVDARMLAAMGRALELRPAKPVEPDRDSLARLHKRRDQLVAMRSQERTRRRGEFDAQMLDSIDQHLRWLDDQVRELDRRIRQLIAASPGLAEAERRLRSVPGIGPVAAATLLALAPELGERSSKAIAALAGLAPFNADSGQKRGQRMIRGGRKRIRDALYMAAVSASRCNNRFAAFYRSLRAANKPAKLALIAVARKLLVTLNAIMRDQTTFQT